MVLNRGHFAPHPGLARPRGHVTTSGDIFHHQDWVAARGIWPVEARDAAKHPSLHRTAPRTHAKKLSSLKGQ